MHALLIIYKACSKKDRTFAIKTLFYNILSTIPFKVVPSTGDLAIHRSQCFFHCWNASWKGFSVMARSSLSHFPESPRVQKKAELFK
jgi:hypothetical protein